MRRPATHSAPDFGDLTGALLAVIPGVTLLTLLNHDATSRICARDGYAILAALEHQSNDLRRRSYR